MIDYAVQAKQDERDKLANDVAAFLASGGKIDVLPAFADEFNDFSEVYLARRNGRILDPKPSTGAAGGRL